MIVITRTTGLREEFGLPEIFSEHPVMDLSIILE